MKNGTCQYWSMWRLDLFGPSKRRYKRVKMKENLSELLLPHSFFTCLWGYYDDWVNVSFVSFIFTATFSYTWRLVFHRTIHLLALFQWCYLYNSVVVQFVKSFKFGKIILVLGIHSTSPANIFHKVSITCNTLHKPTILLNRGYHSMLLFICLQSKWWENKI